MNIKKSECAKKIVLGLFYFLVVCLFTWPLIFHLKTRIYGYPGDAFAIVHRIWYEKEKIPEANPPIRAEGQLVFETLATGFGKIFHEITAYNLIVLVALFFSFINTHILTAWIFKKNDIAVPIAVAYGISQYNLWQGMQHIEFVLAASFLPLLLLSLIKIEGMERCAPKQTFFLAISFSLIILSSFYIGFFAAIFVIAFFFLSRIFGGRAKIVNYLLAFLFLIMLTSSATFPIIKSYFNKEDQSVTALMVKDISSKRKTEELIAYGAKPWDYLSPSINHPVFGKAVISFYGYLKQHLSYQFKSAYLPERANFIPFTIIFLAIYGFFVSVKDRSKRFLPLATAFLTFFMVWVSLPGKIHIPVLDLNFYSPSWLIFKIVPFFRVYARAGVFVLLCFLVLAGFGIYNLLSSNSSHRARLWLFLISLLIIFENLNFPPFNATDLSRIPEVYGWIKSFPKNVVLIDYPRDNSKNDVDGGCEDQLDPKVARDFSYDLFFQTIHEKKLVRGADFSTEERKTIGDLNDKRTYFILKNKGINYIVYHTTDLFPKINPLDECQSRRYSELPGKTYEKIKLIKKFSDGAVYQIM